MQLEALKARSPSANHVDLTQVIHDEPVGRVPPMLLERDEQLRVLTEVLDRTGSDGGKVVLIRGEAGIGKSALVRRFLASEADRAHVLVGYCDDLLTPHPLGPFWDLADESRALTEALRAGDRLGVMRTTLDLLSRELRPTVIVVEDTQWADDATIDAIRYLGRRIAGSNGLLTLTFRDSEVDQTHPLRLVIGELDPGDVVRVRLSGLTQTAIAALVAEAGADLDAAEVYAMTDGNPLFATELARSAQVGLPVSIRDSVLARANKLSPKARMVLDLVSVMPGEGRRAMVLRLSEAGEKELGECVTQGLLEADNESVFFRHELTRHAIESALTAPDRRRLNEAVLGELGADGDPARLVHHAREAKNADAMAQFGPRAARDAMAVGSYQEATAHFRALEPYLRQVDTRERAAIYADWARVETYLNDDVTEILEILDHAIELHRQVGDDIALARNLTVAAELNDEVGKPDEVDVCLGEALTILESHPPGPELAEALGRQAFVAMHRGQAAQAVDLADEALALADQLGDEKAAFNALNAKGGTILYFEGDSSGLDLLEEARRRAAATGESFEEVRALNNAGGACKHRREFALAIDYLERAIEVSRNANVPALGRLAEEWLAWTLLFTGDWERAESLAVTELSRPYSRLATPYAKHVLARIGIRQGRPDGVALLDEVWADAEELDETSDLVHLASARAEVMWLEGTLDTELAVALRRVQDELADEPWNGEVSFWLWMAGDRSGSPSDVPEPFGLAMRGAAEQAAKQWDELSMPYERAVSLVLCDGPEALEGLELLETLGASATASRCRQILRSRGVAIPRGRGRSTRDHPVGLTARQDEVLQLLAEDLTDGEIADRLFVSTRTINHHVSAVLGKLGVSSRTEAADRAHALGLLT